MSVLKHRRGVEAVPTARGVANVMMADLTEAQPVELRRPAPATTRRPLRIDEQARAVDVLFGLQLDDGTFDTAPLELTDWSARLAADFGHVNSALGWLASNTQRCIEEAANVEMYAVRWLFVALAEFVAELDDDRGALYGHINAERVLLAELAPFAAKAGA